jgi:hypothetical protein
MDVVANFGEAGPSFERGRDETECAVRWIHVVVVNGVTTFRVGRCGASLVADWPSLGTLTCRSDGEGASFEPVIGAPSTAVEKLRRGYVRALVESLRGKLALHGSAVASKAGAVLFLGSSGAGKSTAAAELCLVGGDELLADDVVLLNADAMPIAVLPTEGEHWLTAESRAALGLQCASELANESKVAVCARRLATGAKPLALVVVLRFDPSAGGPSFHLLRGVAAARSVLEAILRFDVDDGEARRREIDQLARLHESAPTVELIRNPARPEGVAEFVSEMLCLKSVAP